MKKCPKTFLEPEIDFLKIVKKVVKKQSNDKRSKVMASSEQDFVGFMIL